MQACARLCELHLSVFGQLTVSPELLGPLCGSLVRLRLQGESRGHESAGTAVYAFELEQLSRLEQLWLAGSAVELHRSQLPPSLTQLLLEGFRDLTAPNRHALPRQVRARACPLLLASACCCVAGGHHLTARAALPAPQLEVLAQLRSLHLMGVCEWEGEQLLRMA